VKRSVDACGASFELVSTCCMHLQKCRRPWRESLIYIPCVAALGSSWGLWCPHCLYTQPGDQEEERLRVRWVQSLSHHREDRNVPQRGGDQQGLLCWETGLKGVKAVHPCPQVG
jgi:hypothetical protein